MLAVFFIYTEPAAYRDSADGCELADVSTDETSLIGIRGDNGTLVLATLHNDLVVIKEAYYGTCMGVGSCGSKVSVVHQTLNDSILIENGYNVADTAVGYGIDLVGVVRAVQEVAAVVGRSDNTGTAAQFGGYFTVVHAVLDIVCRVILGCGHESGNTAVHCTGSTVGRIAATVSIDGEGGRAVLDGTGAGARVEHEAGETAQGETFRIAGTGGSNLSADLHILYRG